jgi:membrane protein YdbS with pleckstrin-like domain
MNPDPPAPAGDLAGHPDSAPPAIPAVPEFRLLDPRVVNLWRFHQAFTSALLLGAGFVAAIFAGLASGAWRWIWLGWGALLALRVFLFFWHPGRAYRGWGYRLDGRVLEMREGIWFRSITLLPLSRLQHVDLHSGPLQRSLGLASLILHTAGTHHATIVIPGLDLGEAARLRDLLVAAGGDDAV